MNPELCVYCNHAIIECDAFDEVNGGYVWIHVHTNMDACPHDNNYSAYPITKFLEEHPVTVFKDDVLVAAATEVEVKKPQMEYHYFVIRVPATDAEDAKDHMDDVIECREIFGGHYCVDYTFLDEADELIDNEPEMVSPQTDL